MIILVGIAVFVGSLLIATVWSAIRGTERHHHRRRRHERPYAL